MMQSLAMAAFRRAMPSFLYNNPVYGNASKHIYAGRYQKYKAH